MTCPCLYPLVIKRGGKYYLAFPEDETDIIEKLGRYSFIEAKGTDDGNEIKYLAYPEDHVIKILKLEIDIKKYQGDDYVAVKYKDIESIDHIKEYFTNDHLVLAGCRAPVEMEGKHLKCEYKEIYMSLHPIDEWTDHHVIYK